MVQGRVTISQRFNSTVLDLNQYQNARSAHLGFCEAPGLVGADAIGYQTEEAAVTYTACKGAILWSVPILIAKSFINAPAMRRLCDDKFKSTGQVQGQIETQLLKNEARLITQELVERKAQDNFPFGCHRAQ